MTINRKTALQQDQSLIEGIEKNLRAHKLTIGKKAYAAKDATAIVAERVASYQAVLAAKVAWIAALKVDADVRARTKPFVTSLRTIVMGMYGELPDTLAEFGLSPRKVAKVTVATKVEALEKTKATRAARGTKGKRQRAAIVAGVS